MSPGKRYYPKDKGGNADEWAALLKNQHETATKIKKQQDKDRRDFMTEEFGKKTYVQHLAKRDNAQKAIRDENVADREKVNQRALEHEYQQAMSKLRDFESKQKYAEQVDTQ